MNIRLKRILIPAFYCLAVACLVEIPLGQTNLFGEDVILWDTLFRTLLAMPGLLYFYKEDKIFRSDILWTPKMVAGLMASGAVLSAVFRLVFEMIGMPGYEVVEQNLFAGSFWLQISVLLAASPVLEEFFFRGVLYGRLKELVSNRSAMVISALAFGLYHANPSQGIYGFLMGLFLAWAMERCQTVKAPIVVHVAANTVAVVLSAVFG